MRLPRARSSFAVALAAVLVAVVAAPGTVTSAHAQDRLYWTSAEGTGLSFSALDGSGDGVLGIEKPGTHDDGGLAIDIAQGRFYWADQSGDAIESANFAGGDQQVFQADGVAVGSPGALTIDPASRVLVWARPGAPGLVEARMDGTGGGPVLPLSGEIEGVEFDPLSGRLYWVFPHTARFESAGLDGSGLSAVPLGAEPDFFGGLAIDRAAGRMFFVSGGKIESVNLDGSDLEPLDTEGAIVAAPSGLAIDEATGTIYWGNHKERAISFAKLDGGGAGQLDVTGTEPGPAKFLALFVAPRSLAPPQVTGAAAPGATLACSTGEWAADQPQANLFDAPAEFSYRWTRDGAPVAGADEATFTVPAAGASYGCAVTAANGAGATTVASPTTLVPASPVPGPIGFGAATGVRLGLAPGRVHGATVEAVVENFNPFPVTGSLAAAVTGKRKPRKAAIAARPYRVGAASTAEVALRLPTSLRKLLAARHRLPLKLSTVASDPLGAERPVARGVVLRTVAPGHRKTR